MKWIEMSVEAEGQLVKALAEAEELVEASSVQMLRANRGVRALGFHMEIKEDGEILVASLKRARKGYCKVRLVLQDKAGNVRNLHLLDALRWINGLGVAEEHLLKEIAKSLGFGQALHWLEDAVA